VPKKSSDQELHLPITLWQLCALDTLLSTLICTDGRLDSALIRKTAGQDRDLYADMLTALLAVQIAARRAIQHPASLAAVTA
jgi:hypothetical protein